MDERISERRDNAVIHIKGCIDEDFLNYKEPSMFIITSKCSFKCDIESGESLCQNGSLAGAQAKEISVNRIIKKYIHNPITSAIVFGGLEPFDQFEELLLFVTELRRYFSRGDTVVIYTGYYEEEIREQVEEITKLGNIIIKYGRFIPNDDKRYDEVLGVYLASQNQYAKLYK